MERKSVKTLDTKLLPVKSPSSDSGFLDMVNVHNFFIIPFPFLRHNKTLLFFLKITFLQFLSSILRHWLLSDNQKDENMS